VIDTIAWEGFREALKDTQYLATLMEAQGQTAKDAICANYSPTTNLDDMRENIINELLAIDYDNISPAPPMGLGVE
jgi:hypothetical protein